MSTANIDVRVNSSELNGLINRLQEAEQSLDDVRRSADQAANSVDKVGNATSGATGEVQGFSISGAKAAAAGAAMGIAMVAVEKAMELAAQAAAAINQATIDYIRTTQAGRAAIDGYTEALERSKQEIAKAIADTGLYQKAAESLAAILPQLTTEIIKGIGAIEDAITIYMEYKDVIDGVVGVIQNMIPGLQSVLTILDAGKVVWDGTVQVLDSVATSIRESTTEVEEQTPAIATATSTWDRLTGAMNNNIDSAINVGREYRAVAAVSNLAGRLVGFMQPSLRAQAEAANAAATASATYSQQLQVEAQRVQALVDARNNLEDQINRQAESILADDSIEVRIQRENLLRQATEEQAQFLLDTWVREDREAAERARRWQEYQEERVRQTRERIAAEQRAEEEAARRQEAATAQINRETDDRHEEFKQQIEEKFQLLNGYTVAFEDLTTRQIARLNQLSTEETRFLGSMRGHTEDLAAGTIAALAGAAGAQTSALDAVKESVGQMLIAKGTEAIYSGTIKSVQLNPLGPLEIAAGVTAIAAGSSMSGKGGGAAAAGAGASPSVPDTTPGESMTQYTNVSFGFVGDRRQIGRDVADAQEDARRRGL